MRSVLRKTLYNQCLSSSLYLSLETLYLSVKVECDAGGGGGVGRWHLVNDGKKGVKYPSEGSYYFGKLITLFYFCH